MVDTKTKPLRPDVLAGLSENQRLRRELKDTKYVSKETECLMDPDVLKDHTLEKMAVLTHGMFGPHNIRSVASDDILEACICVRYDLDHPLILSDNIFGDCAICGCNLQFQPTLAPGPRVCICCAARQVREKSNEEP